LRPFLALSFACIALATSATSARGASHLLPRPNSISFVPNCRVAAAGLLASIARVRGDRGGPMLLASRWRSLGISARETAPLHVAATSDVGGQPQSYSLDVTASAATLRGADGDGLFYAWMTLAQLAEPSHDGWIVPCAHVRDAPALRWRVLSDDVSRGPLPTMRYFKERIATIAAFKMNGYSPYMENVFVDPKHPLPSPLDGITPRELGELATYAHALHVALIPEQQTFAHMHGTLAVERYAPLAELPHGYLLSPANPAGAAYVRDVIGDELAVVPHPPFFHIGSDEPSDLGRGRAKALVAADGEGPVFAKHVADTAAYVIAQSGSRPMIWDDALANHPELFAALPKSLVFVNWHYGTEPTYQPYIDRIARGGFEQMIAPGALNWNEIYPDLDGALSNIDRFVTEGKASHVLGLFQTVWHDDGETLFEATWYPVIYAAASAWERAPLDRARYASDFPAAFFGTADPGYASDLADLALCKALLRGNPREYGDYLFWADPFASDLANVATIFDLPALRRTAEDAMSQLRRAPPPPLHAAAARVMALAALRYDVLGRGFEIPGEARQYYDDARSNAGGKHEGLVHRGLFVTKYLFWERRDALLGLVPLVRAAWDYENRSGHEASVLERYHVAADREIERADRVSDTVYRYQSGDPLPTFDELLGAAGCCGSIEKTK